MQWAKQHVVRHHKLTQHIEGSKQECPTKGEVDPLLLFAARSATRVHVGQEVGAAWRTKSFIECHCLRPCNRHGDERLVRTLVVLHRRVPLPGRDDTPMCHLLCCVDVLPVVQARRCSPSSRKPVRLQHGAQRHSPSLRVHTAVGQDAKKYHNERAPAIQVTDKAGVKREISIEETMNID